MKKKMLRIILSGVIAAMSLLHVTWPVHADSEKVVTLGADLDENQKNAVLRYFGVLGQNVRMITITNQDERNHLASYVPIEQIGTRTFSCALVNPTSSGGIRVKTANLNWVTGNMIASTLSTSGVKNCEVLAAAPFEVSGTGALTGVIMAYEDASGICLDAEKKDIAAQELVTTTTLANTVGQTEATNIVNEIKIQVIEGQVNDPVYVEEIVQNTIIHESPGTLSEEDRAMLNDLANRIAEQQYEYEDMKETLERVEQNVNADANANINVDVDINVNTDAGQEQSDADWDADTDTVSGNAESEESSDTESIMDTVDETAFGYEVVTSTTEEPAEEVQEALGIETEEPGAEESVQEDSFMIVSSDSYTDDSWSADQPELIAEDPETQAGPVESEEPDLSDISLQEPESADLETQADPVGSEEPDLSDVSLQGPESADLETQAGPVESEEPDLSDISLQGPESEEVGQLLLEDNTVRILPEEGSNVSGTGVLRIRIAADSVVPAVGDDGSFGNIVVSGPMAHSEILLQDNFDPTSFDSTVVAVQKTDEADLEALGWSEGTDIFINLGTVFAFGDNPENQYTIDIRNLALVRKADDGTVIAKGVLNKTTTVYVDQIGLTFNISEFSELQAGSTVSGYIIMPDDPEDGSALYSAYIDCPSGIVFTVGEDGKSFSAELQQAGDTEVTVNFTADGVNYVPYTFMIPVLQNDL